VKRLVILDLDNTLIYGSYDKDLPAKMLFQYSKHLIIYERPFAREFIQKCQKTGDVVVYTTAIRDYAEKICQHLNLKPIELFSREDCLIKDGMYSKSVPNYLLDTYNDITIIDDWPEIWDDKSKNKCRIIVVPEYGGNAADDELLKIEV